MNRINGTFKFFVTVIIVLGGFKSTMAMEESIKEEKKYKVISREEWQQIRKDDELREEVLRKKVEELIRLKQSENIGILSVSGAERFLCEIEHPKLEVDAIVTALKKHCNQRAQSSRHSYLTYIIGVNSRAILYSELLLLAGADVNSVGYWQTPLHKAVMRSQKGFLERVEHILNAGADVNMKTVRMEETALHAAARLGKLDVVKLLLERGADKSIANKEGVTPIDSATEEGYDEIVELLQNWKKK